MFATPSTLILKVSSHCSAVPFSRVEAGNITPAFAATNWIGVLAPNAPRTEAKRAEQDSGLPIPEAVVGALWSGVEGPVQVGGFDIGQGLNRRVQTAV